MMSTNCPKCNEQEFGVYSKAVRNHAVPVSFVCCEGCGAVLGVFDPKAAEAAEQCQQARAALDQVKSALQQIRGG